MDTKKEIDMKMVIGLMDDNYSLINVDYRENLDNNLGTIAKCIETKSHDALFEVVDECYYDHRISNVRIIMEDIKTKLKDIGYRKWETEKFFEENEDEIECEIYERDDSDPIKDLLGNTDKIPVRIEMISNYDCINSHWFESSGGYSYKDSYFGDMVDTLNLNPFKVKSLLLEHGEKVFGKFPNKMSRNGKEQVSYNQFYEELENSCCGANLLTYTATIDIQELHDADFNLSEIIIPKGNSCGLYSSMQGGGSLLDMELEYDVKLSLKKDNYPYFRLELENHGKGYDYSIKQVYGVCNSFYGKPLNIISQSQINQTA